MLLEFLGGAAVAFAVIGIQERYIKPLSNRALKELEDLILPIVFKRLDPEIPDLLVRSVKQGDETILPSRIINTVIDVAGEKDLDVNTHILELYRRFLELYDPVTNIINITEEQDEQT